jgi:hypothetical protein
MLAGALGSLGVTPSGTTPSGVALAGSTVAWGEPLLSPCAMTGSVRELTS